MSNIGLFNSDTGGSSMFGSMFGRRLSVLDELNSDIFQEFPNYTNTYGSVPYPTPIKSLKLIVSHGNTILPHGPFEYTINSARMGANSIQITDTNITSAFNNAPANYTFNINFQTVYETYDKNEIVTNNYSQFSK
jgi:hypothetical protein